MTARIALSAPILVGTSPAGVEYWARYEGDAERMQTRLERHWARAAKPVRVKWTPTQRDRVLEGLSQETIEKFEAEGVVFRSTYVQGTRAQLEEVADLLDPEESADLASTGFSTTEEQVVFSQRVAYASTLMLQRKLQGRELTVQQARNIAKKRYF